MIFEVIVMFWILNILDAPEWIYAACCMAFILKSINVHLSKENKD